MGGIEPLGGGDDRRPSAARIVAVAFLSFNLSMGCTFGPYGVLISPIEQRLGVSRELSTLAIPVVTFVISLLAPFVGSLTARMSLRLLMIAGSLLMAAGFAVLALAHSIVLFIGAYALLVGPGLSICGMVAPSTLVTRWIDTNRGRALGFASTPALMAALPLLVTFVLNAHGLMAAYFLMSGLMLACAAVSCLAADDPARRAAVQGGHGHTAGAVADTGEPRSNALGDSRFWRIALTAGLYNAVVIMFSNQLVPYATGLGIDPTRAAVLLTVYLVGTLVGTPLVGMAAEKLGGARTLGLLCVSFACYQGLLMLSQPNYLSLALLTGLTGLQGTATIACLALAVSEQFGQASFAKTYGTGNLVGLPFAVASVPIASAIYVRSGSYHAVFALAVGALAIGALLSLSIRRATATLADSAPIRL